MRKTQRKIDKVRASRDGHEFHEAWAARKALQLVMPTDGLVGISVEGLAPADQAKASMETIEIADLVLYYGNNPTFEGAHSIVIVQVKYSKSSESIPYRASDAKKTIRKFAAAFRSHKRTHGAKNVEKKLTFELITNRPITPELREAINGLASGNSLKGDSRKQAAQFISACGLKGKDLAQFAQKVRITGLAGNLKQNKQLLSRVLADWSVASDAMARARLGNIRQLLRDKAGLAGERQNVITRTDVLDALELQSPDDLFPCPASFPEVGKVVEREQLRSAVDRIPDLDIPLLVHGDGGAGKTVFLQSLVSILGETHKTVLFDCFGGGAYRAPDDARHLPKRGLIHIINHLACDGLCDPLLPIIADTDGLVKAFRVRLAQAVATLQRGSLGKQLLLFIDAIDNAAEHASDKGELAFPQLVLDSFHHKGSIAGVHLIVSCRTYRRDISVGDIPCEELVLKPFSPAEAEKYLRDRIPGVTDTHIKVAYSRSEGNPRILEHLAQSDRGLLEPSKINDVIKLNDLLRDQIFKALTEALKRGYKESQIDTFLAGLSVLPPPVPLDEYADAHGIDLSAVRSFAADLAPLLEQTRHGLMFRDEPTETYVREVYAAKAATLGLLAENLFKKQGTSVYAARALPGLLQKLDNGTLLFDLAFDERFPTAITSTVGKQNIRYSRLKAAVLHAGQKQDFDRLVHLLVEMSTLAAVNERGSEYILDYPDLAIASHDVDATRRLFEERTTWPGMRYSRLSIASVLSGDLSDATRHVVNAEEWLHHFYRQDDKYRMNRGGPERFDIASIPLCWIAQGRELDAAQFMKRWKDWYAYEISEHIFTLLNQAKTMEAVSAANIHRFLDSSNSQLGVIAAALSFQELDSATRRSLINALAKVCEKKKTIEQNQSFDRERNYHIEDGLLKAAAIAVALKMHTEGQAIIGAIHRPKPRLWSLMDGALNQFSVKSVISFITYTALRISVERQSVAGHTLLPKELIDIGARIPAGNTDESFRKALKAELEKYYKSQKVQQDEKKSMSYESMMEAKRYIDERHAPLLEMTQAFTAMLSSGSGNGDKQFLELVDVWTKTRIEREPYSDVHETNLFFELLGRHFLIFSIWARNDLKASSVESFVEKVSEDVVAPAATLVEIISIISKRPDLQELAGKTAIQTKTLIEREDEVIYRASLFAQLARAIMPASFEETSSYFRAGLEQMDVIGSGDYQFTNELLLFAGQLRGEEIEERDFHTLSNICELNMPSDEEKFPWLAFAKGLVKTSGYRTIAKLGRWQDRDKISLDYTLLPYLYALIEQDKINPATALGLLRLSDPAELHSCGTNQLAELIVNKRFPNSKELLAELIMQFEQNHPGVFMPDTFQALQKIAERELGKDSEQSMCLSALALKYEKLRNERNEHRNYHGEHDSDFLEKAKKNDEKNRLAIMKIENETDPADETSMSQAIEALKDIQYFHDKMASFFENLRNKVKYADRSKYIHILAMLEAETLDLDTKLNELKECKEQWGSSSAGLEYLFCNIGVPLVQIHADEFVTYGHVSRSDLNKIAELSSIPISILTIELIMIFASADSHLPASVWIGLAAIACEAAKVGEGQTALKRLLNGSSAKLSSTVVDGEWKSSLYPKGSETDIAAGLIWQMLGSPYAARRWRAAHSIRCLSRLGKWDVIDVLIGRYHSTDAHPYQAPELFFYYLHARLWLLIAIARVAMVYPQTMAKYGDVLKAIASDKSTPHVLLRHFAAQGLLACASSGNIVLSVDETEVLKKVNVSPFPMKETKEYVPSSFYQERPMSIPVKKPDVHLDYDFDKLDVASVSDIFEKPRWETRDAITAWVRKFDSQVTSMYDKGGRSIRHQDRMGGTRYQLYGQQLVWHALYFVAGEFLAKYPVVQRSGDDDDPWHDWLRNELLTRNDGLWLADGVDRPPMDAQVNLCESEKTEIVLTGDKAKLLRLLKIGSSIEDELVVAGDWSSNDDIRIYIISALAPPKDSKKLALKLSLEDPFQVWLPFAEGYNDGSEYARSEKKPFEPWIVWRSTDARLDKADPFGVISATRRFSFMKAINAISSLKTLDPFRRKWTNSEGSVAVRSVAWGSNADYEDEKSINGEQLICSSTFLKEVLAKRGSDLLVLVRLRRYDKGLGSRGSQYWHTTAVVRITQLLNFEFYRGVVNKLHMSKY